MRFNGQKNFECSGNMGSADIDTKSVLDCYDLLDGYNDHYRDDSAGQFGMAC